MKTLIIVILVVLLVELGLWAYLNYLIRDVISLLREKQSTVFNTAKIDEQAAKIRYLESELRVKEVEINTLKKGIAILKNPPKPPRYKVGDRAGNFAIWRIDNEGEIAYRCIDANGQFSVYRESQIEAMMKLNQEAKQ